MNNSKKKVIQTIAIICIAIGLYYLIKNYRSTFWFLKIFQKKFAFIWEHPGSALLTISSSIILLLRPIAGFGLLRLKTWGRNLIIVVLSADFIVRAISFYNLHTFALRHPEINTEMQGMIAESADKSQMISIIPSYIIAAVSLISVIILLKINWKEMKGY